MNYPRMRLLGTLVALPALFWSCGDASSPVAPELDRQASGTTSSADLSAVAVYGDGGSSLTIGLAWKWIGPEGGSLRLADFEMVVPAGAVASATRFTIRLDVSSQRKNYVMAEFGPHNRTFATPVILRTPYAGTSAEGTESRVLWWNGSEWIGYPSTVLPDGRLETRTDHFSEWATEDPSRGYIMAGG